MSLEIRNQRQKEAIQAVINNNDIGTVMAHTGFGKSFLLYNWLYSLLERNKINIGETVWILSYTEEQGNNLLNEANSYFKVTKKNPAKDFNLLSFCYAGNPVNNFTLPKVACYDEILSLLF